ncbi:MAG: YgjP-like metallopeptidase domain-containing protein, partial [Thermodesulfobacteriota bacterium]
MVLEYTVQRSAKRRKLTITVERDRSVVVHAPEGISDVKIRQVVESKRQWIYEKTGHPQKYRGRPHPPGKELVSGESALYLGREYRIEVVKTGLTEVQFSQRFLIPATQGKKRVEALREWYIGRAKEKIIPRVKGHARELGVNIAGIKIMDSRYR